MLAKRGHSMKILVIDIGGNNVKMLASGQTEPRKFPSGPQADTRQDGGRGKKARGRLGI